MQKKELSRGKVSGSDGQRRVLASITRLWLLLKTDFLQKVKS